MSLRIDEPKISEDIQRKIQQLAELLDLAQSVSDEILEWYDSELKSYDTTTSAYDELFDAGTGIVVEGISELEILEGLSKVQIFNESQR